MGEEPWDKAEAEWWEVRKGSSEDPFISWAISGPWRWLKRRMEAAEFHTHLLETR